MAGSLGTLAEHLGRLVATDSSTPLATLLVVLVGEVSLGGTDDGGKITLVFALDLLDGNDSRGFLVDYGTKTSLALDNDVGDTHLAAKGRDEDDELDGVDIVGNNDESGLLGLNKGNDVVKTVFHEQGLLGVLGVLVLILSSGGGGGQKTSLLVLLGLRAVLVEELEQLSGGVLVQSVRELGNGRGDLETLVEDNLLALEADVFGPFDEASQVGLGADILANTKVLGLRLEERVLLRLGGFAGSEGGSSGLLSGLGFGRLVIETKSAKQPRKVDNAHRSSSAASIEIDAAQHRNASSPKALRSKPLGTQVPRFS